MGVTTDKINKPFNPRGNDQSPKGYNRAALYSGKALDFDGVNDFVSTPNISVQSTNVWTYTGNINFSSALGYWIDARTSDTGYAIYFDNGSRKIILYSTSGIAFDFVFDFSRWYNISITSNGTIATLYVDGVSVDSSSYSYSASSTGNLFIGQRHNGGNYLDGQLSGIKLFNTALTAAQVADLYNNPEKVIPTGVADSNLKLWLPMMEGAGTTAYDGSPVGFTEDIVTGFTNGTAYPLDSFASSGDDITTAIKTNGFGGCVSNGHYYTNGQKVKVKFTYQKNSGNDLRVLFSNAVTGAGTAKSDIQNVSASGEFEHTFTMTADGVAYLQLGTGNAGHSIDAVITDVYVSPYKSANHGTISGATYTHGIGAPVAQTAVIDWNKGENYVEHSEEIDDAYYEKTNATITADDITAPDGQSTADKINITSDSQSGVRLFKQFDAAQYTMSFYAKAGTQTNIKFYVVQQNVSAYTIDVDLVNGTLSNVPATISDSSITDAGNGWWRITATRTFTAAASNHGYGAVVLNGNGTNFYLWGFQHKKAATIGPYVPTIGTAQTSPVLLPQGLTTGRDITGVNLFENVRKQGALNLDGNSWAEVHDNASLDITDAISLECWYYNDGSANKGLLGRYFSGKTSYLLYTTSNKIEFFTNTASSFKTGLSAGWHHVVGTYDKVNRKIYVDGVLADTDAYTTAISTNDKPIEIGRYFGGTAETYANQIAQPRIYNRALTAEEVQRNYNAGKNTYKN